MQVEGKNVTVSTGQKWKKSGSSDVAFWTVVSVSSEGVIGLSGPGPCRSMQYISIEELESDWEKLG